MWVNRRCFSDEFFFFPSIVALHCQINNVLSEQNTFLMPLLILAQRAIQQIMLSFS